MEVLDLGNQVLTGVFPKSKDAKVASGPLRLVKCSGGEEVCGLVQLQHSCDLSELYGENYGYRSGLNPSMVVHLQQKVRRIRELVDLRRGDVVVDIGSNDSTTLQAYPDAELVLLGIDPTGVKFRKYYPKHIQLIPEFFSSSLLRKAYPNKQARVVTSFSMFYDLEDPLGFMREIREILADDGVWVFEQSYMPTMLETNSYDTVCHEHLEFYALRQIKWMTDKAGLRIVDVEFNDINGGSFSVTAMKSAGDDVTPSAVQAILAAERAKGLDSMVPYEEFSARVAASKQQFLSFLEQSRGVGKRVMALGASTKGNVFLQYCGLTERDIPFVGEVNDDKIACFTPGTLIPIIKESDVLAMRPDYLLILPWHFRKFFLARERLSSGKLVFALPEMEII
jgi:C-methyltransferase C-terminal domain/Methyltransferase domain/Putative zinc binding domain